jgi:LPS export ABC transporter protein LptC
VKKRLSIPLILCSGGLAYALLSAPPASIMSPDPPTEPAAPQPETYARDVSLREYGEDGRLLSRTDATALRRYPDRGVAELDDPQRFGHEGNQGWRASATAGEWLEAREILRLDGDVSLRYDTEGVEFRSDTMVLDLREQTARSATPVRAWQDAQETVADRLFVDLAREVAVLNGNVRSVYVPR